MSELFSYKYGYKNVRSELQIGAIDISLRNGLWNSLHRFYWSKNDGNLLESRSHLAYLIEDIWDKYFHKTIDEISTHIHGSLKYYRWKETYLELREYFFKCLWNEVYDFIQFVATTGNVGFHNDDFISECNIVLKREVSGYRFVGGEILQITAEEEIAEIEEALEVSHPPGVVVHLTTALSLLSDKTSPDYRNSIKESISAVETICASITDNPKATLGKAMGEIRRTGKVDVHPALDQAFDNLYGWTSDEDGVRHKIMDDPNLDFEDAKFMLVACSAFVNYLKVKSSKAGIKFDE